jgi:S1-C subfamily serine protease
MEFRMSYANEEVPKGRIKFKKDAPFERLVRDARYAVFSIIRERDIGNGQKQSLALGSGFFVSPSVFVTAWHVIASSKAPHQDGDSYLVRNIQGTIAAHLIVNCVEGQQLHLHPDKDFAIILCEGKPDQAYLSLDYNVPPEGREIGVLGYPLAAISFNPDGTPSFSNVVFRATKGVVTASYTGTITPDINRSIQAELLEVDFLFVSGNSGGPILDTSNGRAMGIVHGYRWYKAAEKLEKVTLIPNWPSTGPQEYICPVIAIYSLGIRFGQLKAILDARGVTL